MKTRFLIAGLFLSTFVSSNANADCGAEVCFTLASGQSVAPNHAVADCSAVFNFTLQDYGVDQPMPVDIDDRVYSPAQMGRADEACEAIVRSQANILCRRHATDLNTNITYNILTRIDFRARDFRLDFGWRREEVNLDYTSFVHVNMIGACSKPIYGYPNNPPGNGPIPNHQLQQY